MKPSEANEIEESIRLLVEAANKLYNSKNGYSNYGRMIFEITDEIQEQLDTECIEL